MKKMTLKQSRLLHARAVNLVGKKKAHEFLHNLAQEVLHVPSLRLIQSAEEIEALLAHMRPNDIIRARLPSDVAQVLIGEIVDGWYIPARLMPSLTETVAILNQNEPFLTREKWQELFQEFRRLPMRSLFSATKSFLQAEPAKQRWRYLWGILRRIRKKGEMRTNGTFTI